VAARFVEGHNLGMSMPTPPRRRWFVTLGLQYIVKNTRKRVMRTFYGAVTEINDLGTVAEHCPHCDQLKCCLLRTVSQGNYVCFVKIAEPLRESSCMCTDCLKPFRGKPHWGYAVVVPIRDALGMELNDLLAKTNPILADRIRFKEQIRALGGDERFAVAYENVEEMWPGELRSKLSRDLLDWNRLSEIQRDELKEKIGTLSRAWQFVRQITVGFPTSSGALSFFMSAPLFGLILICMLVTRSWIWGGLALASTVAAAEVLESILFKRAVGRWTRQVLVPEAKDVNVPLDCFVAVVDDISRFTLGLTEELWRMKDQHQNIRQTLIADGKLQ
jgi:hypothetical protein